MLRDGAGAAVRSSRWLPPRSGSPCDLNARVVNRPIAASGAIDRSRFDGTTAPRGLRPLLGVAALVLVAWLIIFRDPTVGGIGWGVSAFTTTFALSALVGWLATGAATRGRLVIYGTGALLIVFLSIAAAGGTSAWFPLVTGMLLGSRFGR